MKTQSPGQKEGFLSVTEHPSLRVNKLTDFSRVSGSRFLSCKLEKWNSLVPEGALEVLGETLVGILTERRQGSRTAGADPGEQAAVD